MTILTSAWSAQHPNPGWNFQQFGTNSHSYTNSTVWNTGETGDIYFWKDHSFTLLAKFFAAIHSYKWPNLPSWTLLKLHHSQKDLEISPLLNFKLKNVHKNWPLFAGEKIQGCFRPRDKSTQTWEDASICVLIQQWKTSGTYLVNLFTS